MTSPVSYRAKTATQEPGPAGKPEASRAVPNSIRDDRGAGRFAGLFFPGDTRWLALGFTLIELLIAIAIIGALAAIAVPNYLEHIKTAQTTKVVAELKLLEKEIFVFSMDNKGFPETLADIGRGGLLDPWGNPYQYLNMATATGVGAKRKDHNLVPINSDFDLYSMGPDGKSASPLTAQSSYDDIIRGSNGGYFGPAWAY